MGLRALARQHADMWRRTNPDDEVIRSSAQILIRHHRGGQLQVDDLDGRFLGGKSSALKKEPPDQSKPPDQRAEATPPKGRIAAEVRRSGPDGIFPIDMAD